MGNKDMGPDEIQQLIEQDPFVPFRLTLSSGTTVEVWHPEGLSVLGLSLSIDDFDGEGRPRLRFISMPNIAIVEPMPPNSGHVSRTTGGPA
jgi:hypothetical protein